MVGTAAHALHGRGKMTPGVAMPILRAAAKSHGVALHAYASPGDFAARAGHHAGAAVVLVYNEEDIQNRPYAEAVRRTEVIARGDGRAALVIHPAEVGRVIGSKRRTHKALTAAGVPMPPLVTGATADRLVFSNAERASGRPVLLLRESEALDARRYNTGYVDTAHDYLGRSYFVSLRAMAFGPHLTDVYVRARDTAEGDPSVHAKNTPVDAGLLNHLHATVVLPAMPALREICERIGTALGPGFYASDILPEAGTGRLLVCEVGFKFDDITLRDRLLPVRGSLATDDIWTHAALRRGAQHLMAMLREFD